MQNRDSANIWEAAKTGNRGAIERLIAGGANIDGTDPEHGVTPLAWAALTGQDDIVALLIEKGADVNVRNRDGTTALHAAAFLGNFEAAKLLIEKGADFNIQSHEGYTPLDVIDADWQTTERIAKDLQIDIEQDHVMAGRIATSELLRNAGAKKSSAGPGAIVVLAIVFGSITFVVALVGGIIYLFWKYEKKRTEDLAATAAEIGLDFSPAKDEALLAKMQVFDLFNKGHSRKMKNVMKAETEIANLSIFDYFYTTGGGQHSQTHSHTIVSMESDSLVLPNFTLRPEGFFDRIGAAIGFQDIDFDEHPEFSESFVLKGENEEAIRHFFDLEMLEMFAQRKGIYVESAPGVFIYLRGARKKPDEIREYMSEGYAVYEAFVDRMTRKTSPDSPNL